MANTNVVVFSITGAAGKSTFARHCLVPQLPNSRLVCIEDWNAGDGKADLEISARSFYQLAAQLNADSDFSFVLDIGTSNARDTVKHFSDLVLTRQEIDYWVVPVRAGAKERLDTLRTLESLLAMDIDPSTIVVIAQAVTDVAAVGHQFGALKVEVRELGVNYAEQCVLFNEVYDLLKGGQRTVFDVCKERPDFAALKAQFRGDERRLLEVGNQMLMYSLSATAVRNLMAVFESTPLAAAARA